MLSCSVVVVENVGVMDVLYLNSMINHCDFEGRRCVILVYLYKYSSLKVLKKKVIA